MFASGHLGELTQAVDFALVDAVREETGTVKKRGRLLPSRVVMYFVLALILFERHDYRAIWGKIVASLGALALVRPSTSALCRAVTGWEPHRSRRCSRHWPGQWPGRWPGRIPAHSGGACGGCHRRHQPAPARQRTDRRPAYKAQGRGREVRLPARDKASKIRAVPGPASPAERPQALSVQVSNASPLYHRQTKNLLGPLDPSDGPPLHNGGTAAITGLGLGSPRTASASTDPAPRPAKAITQRTHDTASLRLASPLGGGIPRGDSGEYPPR
ncbi:transposase domain-containing protein [Streptomyces sp. NPDC059455]|uniref:transposase domain-containing protein n=1 Tax=Streptomyces sp. NPDC059455 TaxID=3346837 RepID=UPI0036753D98